MNAISQAGHETVSCRHFFCTSHAIAQPPLRIEKITSHFFVFTTYKDINGTRFPSNGMSVVTDAGVVMIDTPWDTTQLMPLLDTIRLKRRKEVVLAIATHSQTTGLAAFAPSMPWGFQPTPQN